MPEPAEIRHLAEVITDARLKGVHAGPWTLARMILESGYRLAPETLYVVLGRPDEAAAWRTANLVPSRRAVCVWRNPAVLRGLSGPIVVITLPSWSGVGFDVATEVEHSLALIRATTRRTSDTRSYPAGGSA